MGQVSTTKAACTVVFYNLQCVLDFQRGIHKFSQARKLRNLVEQLLLLKSSLLHEGLKKHPPPAPEGSLKHCRHSFFIPVIPHIGIFFLLDEKTDQRVPQKQNQQTALANGKGEEQGRNDGPAVFGQFTLQREIYN